MLLEPLPNQGSEILVPSFDDELGGTVKRQSPRLSPRPKNLFEICRCCRKMTPEDPERAKEIPLHHDCLISRNVPQKALFKMCDWLDQPTVSLGVWSLACPRTVCRKVCQPRRRRRGFSTAPPPAPVDERRTQLAMWLNVWTGLKWKTHHMSQNKTQSDSPPKEF